MTSRIDSGGGGGGDSSGGGSTSVDDFERRARERDRERGDESPGGSSSGGSSSSSAGGTSTRAPTPGPGGPPVFDPPGGGSSSGGSSTATRSSRQTIDSAARRGGGGARPEAVAAVEATTRRRSSGPVERAARAVEGLRTWQDDARGAVTGFVPGQVERVTGVEPPTEDDLGRRANAGVRDATGVDLRGGADRLRAGVIDGADDLAGRFRADPLAAAGFAVATGAALAEPTPFGELLLFGSLTTGALAGDAALRDPEDGRTTRQRVPADGRGVFGRGELPADEPGVRDLPELPALDESGRPVDRDEVSVPADGTGVGAPEVPAPSIDDVGTDTPPAIRAARTRGRAIAREERTGERSTFRRRRRADEEELRRILRGPDGQVTIGEESAPVDDPTVDDVDPLPAPEPVEDVEPTLPSRSPSPERIVEEDAVSEGVTPGVEGGEPGELPPDEAGEPTVDPTASGVFDVASVPAPPGTFALPPVAADLDTAVGPSFDVLQTPRVTSADGVSDGADLPPRTDMGPDTGVTTVPTQGTRTGRPPVEVVDGYTAATADAVEQAAPTEPAPAFEPAPGFVEPGVPLSVEGAGGDTPPRRRFDGDDRDGDGDRRRGPFFALGWENPVVGGGGVFDLVDGAFAREFEPGGSGSGGRP